MTLRTGHGTGAGVPRIEVLPADELPAPLPAVPDPVERRADGTVVGSAAAKALGRAGGLAKASRARVLSGLGLAELNEEHAFRPYWLASAAWIKEHLAALATQVGGEVGPGPTSIVGTAGIQLAASRYFSDEAARTASLALFTAAKTLGDSSRQNLLAAYELARREGEARPRRGVLDDLQDEANGLTQ